MLCQKTDLSPLEAKTVLLYYLIFIAYKLLSFEFLPDDNLSALAPSSFSGLFCRFSNPIESS